MEKKEKKRKETGVLNLAQRPVLDFGKSLVGCAMTSINDTSLPDLFFSLYHICRYF